MAQPPELFVPEQSIVREIWGNADTIMLVFAGSAAEFALNRAVDWLFFTGKLPADPIGRLFSTASFAREIVFSDAAGAERTLARITAIHGGVEHRRGQQIPEWAHRDVLYMLIDYSERAFRLLRRPLTAAEQTDLYAVFRRVGLGLGIAELPLSYPEWQADRLRHMQQDLVYSADTARLYARYREHLGALRYRILIQTQSLLVPEQVRAMLQLAPSASMRRSLWLYPVTARLGLRPLVQKLLIPPEHLADMRQLDQPRAQRGGGLPAAR